MRIDGEKYLNLLKEVVSIPTAPFYEDKVIKFIKQFAQEREYILNQDVYGNLVIEYHHGPTAPILGLMAHMDHPGFEIVANTKHYLKLAFLGGGACPNIGDDLVLFCNGKKSLIKVAKIIRDKETKRATHVLTTGHKKSYTNGFAMYNVTSFRRLKNKIHSRAIDDLVGCSTLLALIDILYEQKPQAHVHFIFTRAEETGFIGACGMALANILPKNLPIITLEASKMLPIAKQGHGVVVRIGDRFSIFEPQLTGFLIRMAKELAKNKEGFKFQKAILDGGICESSLLYTFGYPTSGLAVPLGCYHNHGKDGKVTAEHIHIKDWYNMLELLWIVIIQSEKRIGHKETGQAKFVSRFQRCRDKLAEIKERQ